MVIKLNGLLNYHMGCAFCQEFMFGQKLQKWRLLNLIVFQQNGLMSCPQLLLDNLRSCYEILWSVRLSYGDVHIIRSLSYSVIVLSKKNSADCYFEYSVLGSKLCVEIAQSIHHKKCIQYELYVYIGPQIYRVQQAAEGGYQSHQGQCLVLNWN